MLKIETSLKFESLAIYTRFQGDITEASMSRVIQGWVRCTKQSNIKFIIVDMTNTNIAKLSKKAFTNVSCYKHQFRELGNDMQFVGICSCFEGLKLSSEWLAEVATGEPLRKEHVHFFDNEPSAMEFISRSFRTNKVETAAPELLQEAI